MIKANEKVGASESTLLGMLKIFPFSYGLKVMQVYEAGATYDPNILDITDDDLLKKFMQVGIKIHCIHGNSTTAHD